MENGLEYGDLEQIKSQYPLKKNETWIHITCFFSARERNQESLEEVLDRRANSSGVLTPLSSIFEIVLMENNSMPSWNCEKYIYKRWTRLLKAINFFVYKYVNLQYL